ncbi:MAG: hypothetical protein AAFQ87_18890, partial [Bacteroidota bacterium]
VFPAPATLPSAFVSSTASPPKNTRRHSFSKRLISEECLTFAASQNVFISPPSTKADYPLFEERAENDSR